MKGDMTIGEHLAKQLQDPEFAAAWAVEKPFGNLALNVWHARTERGWTQQQLAQRAAIRQPRIAEIERGDANPTLLTISRIAHALGVTPSRLLADGEPERKPVETRAKAPSHTDAAKSPTRRRATA